MEGWTEMAEYSIYMDILMLTEWYYPEEEPYDSGDNSNYVRFLFNYGYGGC